jgi:hypothetical protein
MNKWEGGGIFLGPRGVKYLNTGLGTPETKKISTFTNMEEKSSSELGDSFNTTKRTKIGLQRTDNKFFHLDQNIFSISIKHPIAMTVQALLYLTTITGHFHHYPTAVNRSSTGRAKLKQ